MSFLVATQSNWFLIGPIAWVLGHLMNWIFEGLNFIGLPNIGLAIILFTLVIKALMIPLSIRQQKYSKLQSVIQPEIQKIQAKYKDKKDNASVMAQQQETKEVYAKYGTSATGGCLQTLLQMPILFALYQVIWHMPGYITKLREYFETVAISLQNIAGYETNEELIKLFTSNSIQRKGATLTETKYIVDMLYSFNPDEWNQFLNIFNNAELTSSYTQVADKINSVNTFLGINLTMTPMQQLWPAIFIPILAGGLQWLASYLM
ncbi:MAG: YidC/Oxa1 family membrane protein insertase, partial [Lachnospiraceae bacterium]|nr:YidC/Oxa1 family membrane protein insertase [Lachnospiraceae bacterium]